MIVLFDIFFFNCRIYDKKNDDTGKLILSNVNHLYSVKANDSIHLERVVQSKHRLYQKQENYV